jgi:hypothetical protein
MLKSSDFPVELRKQIKAVVKKAWSKGIQNITKAEDLYTMKLSGNPWFVGGTTEAVESRYLMLEILYVRALFRAVRSHGLQQLHGGQWMGGLRHVRYLQGSLRSIRTLTAFFSARIRPRYLDFPQFSICSARSCCWIQFVCAFSQRKRQTSSNPCFSWRVCISVFSLAFC